MMRSSCARWFGLMLLHAALLGGCGDGAGSAEDDVWVDVGVTGGPDGLDFVPLAPGGPLPLHTFGQGGTHALLAVRCNGLGNRAFVGVSIAHVESGREASIPPTESPRLLLCRDEGPCDLLPLLVMTGGLAEPGASAEGLPIVVRAEARNEAGAGASVEREAVLSAEAL